MKKIFMLILVIIISMSFASAFILGENGSIIEKEYGAGDFLRGKINISLQNESANSLFSCFNQDMSVIDFLEKAGKSYDCIPDDCENYYEEVGEGVSSKSFSLNKESRIVGLKFQGELKEDPKVSVSFDITGDAGESCFQPLKIDLLDNGEIEGYYFKGENDFSCSYSTGCFDASATISEPDIGETQYCGKIAVPPNPKYQVGAYIIQGTTPNPVFTMQVYDSEFGKLAECILPIVEATGEKSCNVSLNLTETQDLFVCVKADKTTDYKIRREYSQPCGFYGSDYENPAADYYVFAKAGKYSALGTFTFNEDEFGEYNPGSLENYVESYLYERFDNDCSSGCVVPIKLTSGINQGITLSNLQLNYDTSTGLESDNKFYDVEEDVAKISTDFIELDLKYANFSVPSLDGSHDAKIYLDGDLVIEDKIDIFSSMSILGLSSQEIPAVVPYKLTVYVSQNATSYKWDFGEGTIETTTTNEITHTYDNIGNYNLKIEVEDSQGRKSIKTFPIEVVSPKDFIALSLEIKRKNLNTTIAELEGMSSWYKKDISKLINLDDLDGELEDLEKRYDLASSSDEYVKIMSDLQLLKVPYSIRSHYSSGQFLLSKGNIDPSYLIELGIETKNPEEYKEPIVVWFNEYIEMDTESQIIYLYYSEELIPVLTAIKLKINPKKDFLRDSYLVIDRIYDEVTFKDNYNEKAAGLATAVSFSELRSGQEKTIEFILPEKIEALQIPVYISPGFSELPEIDDGLEPYVFPEFPWKKIIIYLSILLIIAFIIYIAMQEWYKRYYEGHLFKNKNDLFNLIHFITNALNQGLSKKSITKKLKEHKWSLEQIVYAFKKAKGRRTGMWEIPIFKIFERRKIKKELAKREAGITTTPKQENEYRLLK